MAVYGDILFLINFSMDFLCFYLSCLLLHIRLPVGRACIASVIGGIYAVASLFIKVGGVMAFALDVGVLVLMCVIVYLRRGIKYSKIIWSAFLYILISALLGGVMTSLFSLFNRMDIFDFSKMQDDGMSVWLFSILAILGTILTLGGGRIFSRSVSIKTVALTIRSDLGEVDLSALVDSGNLATEPISGRAVVFASLEACKGLFDEHTFQALSRDEGMDKLPMGIASTMRLIPSTTLGGSSLLPARRFRDVRVKIKNEEKPIDVYIAFVKGETLGNHDAIISDKTII